MKGLERGKLIGEGTYRTGIDNIFLRLLITLIGS